jgi:hypothetical protein
LDKAKELDRYYEEHGELVGPLHGIPVSLKDQFHVKGLDTSMGYIGWIGTFEGQKATGKERVVESELVKELNVLGAIPTAKVRREQPSSSDLRKMRPTSLDYIGTELMGMSMKLQAGRLCTHTLTRLVKPTITSWDITSIL